MLTLMAIRWLFMSHYHQSCAEAWKLMLSRNNLLSPATGEPNMVPQDMVLDVI
jgi:DNA-directed RNA polymerase beta' subunit